MIEVLLDVNGTFINTLSMPCNHAHSATHSFEMLTDRRRESSEDERRASGCWDLLRTVSTQKEVLTHRSYCDKEKKEMECCRPGA